MSDTSLPAVAKILEKKFPGSEGEVADGMVGIRFDNRRDIADEIVRKLHDEAGIEAGIFMPGSRRVGTVEPQHHIVVGFTQRQLNVETLNNLTYLTPMRVPAPAQEVRDYTFERIGTVPPRSMSTAPVVAAKLGMKQ